MVESNWSPSSRRNAILHWVQLQVCLTNYQARPPPNTLNGILCWDWRDHKFYEQNSFLNFFANDYDFRRLIEEYITLILTSKIILQSLGLEVVFLDLVLIQANLPLICHHSQQNHYSLPNSLCRSPSTMPLNIHDKTNMGGPSSTYLPPKCST